MNKVCITNIEQLGLFLADELAKVSGNRIDKSQQQTVLNRIKKRLHDLGDFSVEQYYQYYNKNQSQERDHLFSLFSTHQSVFFKDISQFQYLEENIEQIKKNLSIEGRKEFRILSAACGNGDEVYSLAMLFNYLLPAGNGISFKVDGIDIDASGIETAENGVYLYNQIKDLPQKYIKGNWQRGTGDIAKFVKVKKHLKERCHFQKVNLLQLDKILSSQKYDLIFCRNTLTNFGNKTAIEVIRNLLTLLSKNGFFFTGINESINYSQLSIQKISLGIYANKPHSTTNELQAIGTSEKKIRKVENKISSNEKVNSPQKSVAQLLKKKVLIVDDSKTIQKLLTRIIEPSQRLEVMAVANCPSEAREFIEKETPDLITLDIHMPEMNGVEFLKSYLKGKQIPTIMISSVSINEGPLVMEALTNGANSYIQKPSLEKMASLSSEMLLQMESIAFSKAKISKGEGISKPVDVQFSSTDGIIAIGSSTGGTQALQKILTALPKQIPPILIVQHIPAVFSKALADRLNSICKLHVKEVENGETLSAGTAYIAPGGKQFKVKKSGNNLIAEINDDPPVNRFRPSVDYLFKSIEKVHPEHLTAMILTGMGKDGAKGLLDLKNMGARTIAQDEDSCVVFGMPKAAIEIDAAEHIINLDDIARELILLHNKKPKNKAA